MTMNARKLRYLIEDAVLSSYDDGSSTGVLLSGGIDSSTVACLADGLPLFTGYYRGEAYDERPWARIVAGDREWHEIEITEQDFIENIDACLACIEPPFQGPGTFGQFMVAKYVARHVDIVLSGEGGDELFGGYARVIAVAGQQMPEGYEDYLLPPGYPVTLPEALAREWDHLPALLAVDEQVTRTHGLKAIAPMAEYEPLVSYVLSLDPSERVGKRALKEAMRDIVPDAILSRTDKRGFPVPFVEWAQGSLREFVSERIGYVPDADKPWDRKWWLDLCEGSRVVA
jgi:asparagine synthetase B (glutamine-hydrolysing)